ncbi:putative ribonuclease H-like domain-containing protein [Tanacetum coccineum]
MVNWSDHAAENKTGEVEKVYGMMAGLHADNGGADASHAAAEFAMMGISPKVQNCPLGCDSKLNDLNNMYNNLDRLYNECYIKVQAYQNAVKTLESQKDWYHKTQIALEEKIRVLTANLENTTNTLSYTEKLHDQAQNEKKEGSCFKEYFGENEVFDLSRPSAIYPEPVDLSKPLYSWFVKDGEMHTVLSSSLGTYLALPSGNSSASLLLMDCSCCCRKEQQSILLVDQNLLKSVRTNLPGWSNRQHCFLLVTLGGIKDHTLRGPRVMVDLINPHGFTLNDPQGRLKPEMAWVSQVKEACRNLEVEMVELQEKRTHNGDIELDFENVYYLKRLNHFNFISELQPEQNVTCLVAKASLDESTRWHRRMAHVNFKTINKLAKEGLVDGLPLKDETFYVLKEFIALIENQLNKKVKGIRCDNGTEFKNAKLIELCGEKGIKRDYRHIQEPTTKWVAERKIGLLYRLLETIAWQTLNYLPCSSDSKAYRAYNLTNKRVEETMNLRFLEDKPNVRGIGHEWYIRNNINAVSTQDLDSDSEVDEQVIVVPSFPSNSVAGPSSSNGPSVMERNADYAEELAKLQRQEYEAKDAAARYGYLFSQATAEILCQAEAKIRNQGVSAVRDPAGIDSAVRDPAGIDSAVRDTAGIDSAGGVSAGSPSAGSDPAGGNPADSFQPAGCFEPADESNPAVSSSISADFIPVSADESTLPPGQSLGSSANTTRFPLPSDVCMDQLTSGIFTSSSYDDDFSGYSYNFSSVLIVKLSSYKKGEYNSSSVTDSCQDNFKYPKRESKMVVCKKQTIVATSSTEAEYVAAASCCAQVLWIQNQLLDYGFNFMNTKIFIDNQRNHMHCEEPWAFHQRTKHIEIRHHFIRDVNEKNLIQVLKIHTDDNVADLLSKAFDDKIWYWWTILDVNPFFRELSGVNTAARCTFFLLTGLVSAGRTMVLLVVILSAGRLVSAGRTMVLLGLFLLADLFHAVGVVYATNTSIHAAGLFDIAGWLVSATSHLVSAGSIQSCWWNNVSAA